MAAKEKNKVEELASELAMLGVEEFVEHEWAADVVATWCLEVARGILEEEE